MHSRGEYGESGDCPSDLCFRVLERFYVCICFSTLCVRVLEQLCVRVVKLHAEACGLPACRLLCAVTPKMFVETTLVCKGKAPPPDQVGFPLTGNTRSKLKLLLG